MLRDQPSEFFQGVHPHHPQGGLVDIDEVAIFDQQQGLFGFVKQFVETLFALAQTVIRFVPLSYIEMRAADGQWLAVIGAPGYFATVGNPNPATVPMAHTDIAFVIVGFSGKVFLQQLISAL